MYLDTPFSHWEGYWQCVIIVAMLVFILWMCTLTMLFNLMYHLLLLCVASHQFTIIML